MLAEHRASLGACSTTSPQINAALAASKGDIATLLDEGTPLIDQLADLVGNHKAELDCDLKVLEVLVDTATTPRQLAGLRALLTWAPAAFGAIWDTRDLEPDGVWLRVSPIQAPLNDQPVQYNPPRLLPPVVAGAELREHDRAVGSRLLDGERAEQRRHRRSRRPGLGLRARDGCRCAGDPVRDKNGGVTLDDSPPVEAAPSNRPEPVPAAPAQTTIVG